MYLIAEGVGVQDQCLLRLGQLHSDVDVSVTLGPFGNLARRSNTETHIRVAT